MSQKVIPIIDAGIRSNATYASSAITPLVRAGMTEGSVTGSGTGSDRLGRRLRDLRISVTDRCNFRCVYCMPKAVFNKDFRFLPQTSLLSFEEIERLARVAVAQGVEKIRLTGGEPLLRKGLPSLIERLASLRTPDDRALDITLTTNGSLLRRQARSLADAGLSRLSVSLDALDETRFREMNDVDFPVAKVLDGIAAAREAGLPSIKVNMVVKRGVNDVDIVPMAQHFHGTGIVLRFIEYMDVGESNGWRLEDTVPSHEVIARVGAVLPLLPARRAHPADTATRWRYADGGGEIGVISSVTDAFCGECTRARLSTEGKLYLCLFATQGFDLRALLRDPSVDDVELARIFGNIWAQRDDQYSALRTSETPRGRRVEMSYIGG